MDRRTRLTTFVGLAVIAGVAATVVYVKSSNSCDTTQTAAVRSPDGKWVAEQTVEQCDDQVSHGAVYVSTPDGRFQVLTSSAKNDEIRLTWISGQEIQVTYPSSSYASRVYYTGAGPTPEKLGLTVTYREVSP